jgi:hypothetical protein
MTEPTAFRLRQLASPRKPTAPGRGGRRVVALLLRLGCVALLARIGYIHLHLWQEGYRQIHTNGPLFLLDAVAGCCRSFRVSVAASSLVSAGDGRRPRAA